jgi:hypothetical protein
MNFFELNKSNIEHGFHAVLGVAFATTVGWGVKKVLQHFFTTVDETYLNIGLFFVAVVVYSSIYFISRYGKITRLESELSELKKLKESLEVSKAELLEKSNFLYGTCGLTEYSEKLADSKFRPEKLLSSQNLKHLDILGNGCSKWTNVDRSVLLKAIEQISSRNGQARFLIQCPIELQRKGKPLKAKKNADSLLLLKGLIDVEKRAASDNASSNTTSIAVKVYTHKPVFRLTIVNQTDTVVLGHYGGGDLDSNDTPLLIFSNIASARWNFHQAFIDYFAIQWSGGVLISDENWKKIKTIADPDF